MGVRGVCLENPVLTFQDLRGAHYTRLGESHAHEGIMYGEARVQSFIPAAVLEVLHGARGFRSREPEGCFDRLRIQAFQDGDGSDGTEDPGGGSVVESAAVRIISQFPTYPTRHLIRDGDGQHKVFRQDRVVFGCRLRLGQRGRDGGHAGVQRAFRIRVVEVQAMGECCVQEAGVVGEEVRCTFPYDGAHTRGGFRDGGTLEVTYGSINGGGRIGVGEGA